MPISRSQMERQLRMGGGIMNIQPRQQYGLGSIVKSIGKGVKKAVSGVKDFAKSDIGKMAILAAGGYALGGGFGAGGFKFGNLPGAGFFGPGSFNPLKTGTGASKFGSMLSGIGRSNVAQQVLRGPAEYGATTKGMGSLGKTLGVFAGGSALGALMGAAEEGDQEAIAATRDVGALKGYLASYYSNLGYSADQIATNVERDTAEYTSGSGGYATGGRVGAMYGCRMKLEEGTLDPRIREIVIDLMDNEGFEFGEAVKEAYRRVESTENKANGGRMGYAYGSNDLVDQASGIMNLPKRVNNAGVKELDLRDSGGFIPPVGVKEKADDIPAMLSNNEFVFTADSVRGFGDGDVNKGAQRMYDMMKKLEKGGRV